MRAFLVRALPRFLTLSAVVLSPVSGSLARAETGPALTDPVITGEPHADPGAPGRPGRPGPLGKATPAARDVSPAPSGTPLKTGEASSTRAQRLDALFAELKRAPSHETAAPIAARIQEEWADSGSATVDLMLLWAGEAMAKDEKAAALDFLDQAVILKPDYAEAWNRRATLNYVASDYGKSIADIEKTLSLEPRHYGALMGLGMILEETDRKPQALEIYMRVLDVYPANKGAQDAVGRLSEELTGQPI